MPSTSELLYLEDRRIQLGLDSGSRYLIMLTITSNRSIHDKVSI